MRRVLVTVCALLGLWAWRAELFEVGRATPPRPLAVEAARQAPSPVDVVLPRIPVGLARLESGRSPLLVHYWAPWELDARAQVLGLDSLRRQPGLEEMQVAVVCFDPFPSVARYVARQRLRLAVLLDPRRALAATLPCPSLPFTYVLDREGRVAVSQSGRVDWLAPATGAALRRLIEEPDAGGARRPPGPDSERPAAAREAT